MTPTIVPATPADAPAMHALQLIAFEAEAQVSQTRDIPPLQETVDDIRDATVLKATDSARLLGSVRGIVTEGTCLIRILVVEPRSQGRGIGAALLRAIEVAHPQVERFELTTNMAMAANLRFYLRHGYAIVDEAPYSPTIRLAFMRKPAVGR